MGLVSLCGEARLWFTWKGWSTSISLSHSVIFVSRIIKSILWSTRRLAKVCRRARVIIIRFAGRWRTTQLPIKPKSRPARLHCDLIRTQIELYRSGRSLCLTCLIRKRKSQPTHLSMNCYLNIPSSPTCRWSAGCRQPDQRKPMQQEIIVSYSNPRPCTYSLPERNWWMCLNLYEHWFKDLVVVA